MSGFAEQEVALRRLAALLDDTARRLAGLPAAIAAAWDEPAGREWSDRLELARRETVRRAVEAADLAARVAADGAGTTAGADGVGAGTTAATAGDADGDGAGPRLGGVSGTRSTDRRGLVAPLLPAYDPPDPGRTG